MTGHSIVHLVIRFWKLEVKKLHDWAACVCDILSIKCLNLPFHEGKFIDTNVYCWTSYRCDAHKMLDITYKKFSNPNSTSWICLPFMFFTCKLNAVALCVHALVLCIGYLTLSISQFFDLTDMATLEH